MSYLLFVSISSYPVEHTTKGRVGSINDYDPMNEQWGSLGHGYRPTSSTQVRQEWEETIPEPRQPAAQPGRS